MSDIVRDPYGNPLNRDKLITALRAEIERLRAALEELLWYTNQLELAVYDPAEWPSTHGAVRAARAALQQEPKP